jgi:flagellar biosynthesis protein FlhB
MHHNVEHSNVLYSAHRMYFWVLGGSQNIDYPYEELIVWILLSIMGWFIVCYIYIFLTQFSLTFVVKRIKPKFKIFQIM